MRIVCPNCATSYELTAAALGEGRSVRCARCRTVWFATPQPEPVETEPVMAAVEAVEPDESAPEGAVVGNQSAPAAAAAAEAAPASEYDWSFSPDKVTPEGETQSPPATDAAQPKAGADLGQSEVDALWAAAASEPVAQDESPPLVPALEPDPVVEPHVVPENVETVAARRAPKAKKKRNWGKLPRPGLPVVIVALAATLAGLILWRSQVVQVAPQTASLFKAIGLPINLRGLVFENVRTTGEVHEGVAVLIVEGTIANATTRTIEVPRLRFALRNRAGHEIYAWTSVTGRSILAQGETAAFRSRLASPPPDGRDVIVRFFNRRDFLAGMR